MVMVLKHILDGSRELGRGERTVTRTTNGRGSKRSSRLRKT